MPFQFTNLKVACYILSWNKQIIISLSRDSVFICEMTVIYSSNIANLWDLISNLGALDPESVLGQVAPESLKKGVVTFPLTISLEGKCKDWLARASVMVQMGRLTCLQ